MCDLLVPLATCLDVYRVGSDHDAFSDHPFDGLSREAKDVEEPDKDIREGKSYLSLMHVEPSFANTKS